MSYKIGSQNIKKFWTWGPHFGGSHITGDPISRLHQFRYFKILQS